MAEVSVLVSIPTKEWIHAATMGWVLNAIQDATKVGYVMGVHILCSPYPLEHQRNNQIFDFLSGDDYTHLFLLDSDNVPQRGTVEKFLDYDLDVVHAVGAAFIDGKQIITAGWETKKPNIYFRLGSNHENAKGLQKVDGVGASGVLIKRHVLEALKYPYFKVKYNKKGDLVLGEDYYFCKQIKKAGFDIWADFDMQMQHFKTVGI